MKTEKVKYDTENPIRHEIIRRRYKIAIAYCKKLQWESNTLTFEQILEIRKQQDWIDVPRLLNENMVRYDHII